MSHRRRPSPDHSRRAVHGVDTGEGGIRTRGDPGGLVEAAGGLLVGTDPPEELPLGASRRGRSACVWDCWSGAPRASVPTCLCQGAVCSPTFSSRLWEATCGTCTGEPALLGAGSGGSCTEAPARGKGSCGRAGCAGCGLEFQDQGFGNDRRGASYRHSVTRPRFLAGCPSSLGLCGNPRTG